MAALTQRRAGRSLRRPVGLFVRRAPLPVPRRRKRSQRFKNSSRSRSARACYTLRWRAGPVKIDEKPVLFAFTLPARAETAPCASFDGCWTRSDWSMCVRFQSKKQERLSKLTRRQRTARFETSIGKPRATFPRLRVKRAPRQTHKQL